MSIITFRISFNNNIRDEYCNGLDLHDGPLAGGEDRHSGNVPALEVHQHGGVVQPLFTPQAAVGLRPG
jgi:Cu/Zn superoxide dismutase